MVDHFLVLTIRRLVKADGLFSYLLIIITNAIIKATAMIVMIIKPRINNFIISNNFASLISTTPILTNNRIYVDGQLSSAYSYFRIILYTINIIKAIYFCLFVENYLLIFLFTLIKPLE